MDQSQLGGALVNGLRPIRGIPHYLKYPEGSCRFQMGHTKVVCTATLTNDVPDHAKAANKGWLTAEYSMLPRATTERSPRGKIASGGRTKEISRLIGRSLRAVLDLKAMAGLGILMDCDVIQADGGTRAAAINGGFIAVVQALRRYQNSHRGMRWPIRNSVAAVSVGMVNGRPLLDLDYANDLRADVDLNVVMTGTGHYVEIQGTAEGQPFSKDELNRMLERARAGIRKILAAQRKILGQAIHE
jgi:ribonuclease PH